MKISRLDLDGAGSPKAIVTRILEIEPDLPIPVPIEDLCERLDIISIGDLETDGFEAALVTDAVRSKGGILIAKARSPQRRRFSIGHELGHFLIPAHMPPPDARFLCSADQLRLFSLKEQDFRRRMEAEANRFSALLLMPPPILRNELQKIRSPGIADIVRLAAMFNVSKDAMARAYVDYSHEAVAVIVIRDGLVLRSYRKHGNFPWIAISAGQAVPVDSIYHIRPSIQGAISPINHCEPHTWLGERDARNVDAMTEQLLVQQNGHALVLLHADIPDDDDDFWRSRR